MLSASVPPTLKKIKVFLTRAEELDRDKSNPESRVVAYNVRQYAVLTGIPLAVDDNEKACLGELLNILEKEKDAMSVFSKEEHWKICRKVADRVFDMADKEDRCAPGGANKGTAKSFYAAGTFYEILQQFYPNKEEKDNNINDDDYNETKEQQDEEEKRRLYCKWKATDILNAIKEGRTPTPGGFQEELGSGDGDIITSSKKEYNNSTKQIEEKSSPSSSLRASLPPAPSMPSSDFFNDYESNTGNHVLQPPPPYDGFELNLNGDVAPVVEDVNEGDEESGIDDFCNIPSRTTTTNSMFVNDMPPPAYASAGSNNASPSILPPPVTTRPLPPPIPASQPTSSKNPVGVISSLFNKSSPSPSSTKLSKEKMADAIELTKFALAALQKGDSELGRERLEQTLGLWRR